MDNLIAEVKKKKEFSELPDSIIARSITRVHCDSDMKTVVKEVRRDLRKYFGVFLTNRVLKPRDSFDYVAILKYHKSSQLRDYESFYKTIKDSLGKYTIQSIFDLGSGMNGFSYPFLQSTFGDVTYTGLEASGQVVSVTNAFFETQHFKKQCKCVHGDLFDRDLILKLLKKQSRPSVVFLLQVVDALEFAHKDFSKTLLVQLKKHCSFIVVSNSLKSISGKKVFESKRDWFTDFLHSHFIVLDDFVTNSERVFVLQC